MVVSYVRIQRSGGSVTTGAKNRAVCPVCFNHSVALDLSSGRHVRCPECGAELVLKFRYYTVYVLISVLGALLLAHFQRLDGPLFVGGALLYFVVLLTVGFFIVVRLFPLKVELNDQHGTTKLRL